MFKLYTIYYKTKQKLKTFTDTSALLQNFTILDETLQHLKETTLQNFKLYRTVQDFILVKAATKLYGTFHNFTKTTNFT